ncbi:phosphoribosylformylglycinamidine synthase [Candidatus Erwinia haradaeae]|uniref:phosphoribosylformylglycinamidine synthase n=1 Tax=Candidatus Erwinia haradaeae TaxID=1922217 RepID=UPI001E62207A|nr:phosphoribosylformylglycinamidine synthase [Candidatus Erwinia haradaeae]
MEILPGPPALSVSKIKKLLNCFQKKNLPVSKIYAEYTHFVHMSAPLNQHQQTILQHLLQYGPTRDQCVPEGQILIVTPRPGTLSTWSSKATEIAHHCSLTAIQRIERGKTFYIAPSSLTATQWQEIGKLLYDPMTESILTDLHDAKSLFIHHSPCSLEYIDTLHQGREILVQTNEMLNLALSEGEIDYLMAVFNHLQRNPTDVELYMFAQMNSEHCRHKIFNSHWIINGKKKNKSLFALIQHTFTKTPDYILSAYRDNAAVMEGSRIGRFYANQQGCYEFHPEITHIVMKVETHNHPTAISPWPGAATGAGGEIRDEGATGRGAKPKAGLSGFSVSNLCIPGFQQPWEEHFGKPNNISNALDIIIEGSLGGAAFNNEFGRPMLSGYFRTYEERIQSHHGFEIRGYHKPIMLVGGIGNIRADHVKKCKIKMGDKIIILGGPAMKIGLGGGTASSVTSGQSNADNDFASVQRDNPEMERRCQEVIDRCWQLKNQNPILSIHDIGAGGISNALPEMLHHSQCGGMFNLRHILSNEPGMSPLEIWCNESQERYLIAISSEQLPLFDTICQRERTPYSVIGEATTDKNLSLFDNHFDTTVIDIPIDVLFNHTLKLTRNVSTLKRTSTPLISEGISLADAVYRILHLPAVAEKTFLVTICDRSIGGMVVRDQMVGPWQLPVADCAVTSASLERDCYCGEAIAIGERAPVSLLDYAASGRLAVGEALTNIVATQIGPITRVKLSANWMAATSYPGEDAGLYEVVQAVSNELCPKLGITIPVGKDSLSMQTRWNDNNEEHIITAPVSLIITAFARVEDIRKTVTPQLKICDNTLLLIDLGNGCNAMGATALAQVYRQLGDKPADIRDVTQLANFWKAMQTLLSKNYILAYHDRSDGGLFITLAEMAFAGHCGVDVDITTMSNHVISVLFNEELGAVIQVKSIDLTAVKKVLEDSHLMPCVHILGKATPGDIFSISQGQSVIYRESRIALRTWWAETTWQIQRIRDNPICADQEHISKMNNQDPGLHALLTFDPQEDIAAPFITSRSRPKVAVLREQGVNSHVEMAAAFHEAGFEAIDIHMSDLISGSRSLRGIHVLAACGGFSYGDVLGAGEGWAKSILLNHRLHDEFSQFFQHPQTLTLGVCNGCQMLSNLRALIPGSQDWPRFVHNKSECFESRFSLVEISNSSSLLLEGMIGSRMPIAVSHGEGYAEVRHDTQLTQLEKKQLVAIRFIDNFGNITEQYPANPNGSPRGIAAVTSENGRVTIMMPHPERVYRTITHSWHPEKWGVDGPWMRIFRNARKQLG